MFRVALSSLRLLTTAHVEHVVQQQATDTDDDGWSQHKQSPFPWDEKNSRASDGRDGKGVRHWGALIGSRM